MPFEPIHPEKLSHGVVRQVELLVLRGILRPGDRLPPERELAERLGVSRPSLREALAELQRLGLVETRAGAGVFVSNVLGSAFSPALVRLFASHDEAVVDMVGFRRDIEGIAAARAARHGSDADLEVIDAVFRRMEAAQSRPVVDAETEARLDAEFHLAIIEAGHNVVMLHMMRSIYDLLREGVFYNRQVMFRQRLTRDSVLDQHRAINAALQNRDAEAAKAAITAHLDYVQQALSDQRLADRNEEIARRRLSQERAR